MPLLVLVPVWQSAWYCLSPVHDPLTPPLPVSRAAVSAWNAAVSAAAVRSVIFAPPRRRKKSCPGASFASSVRAVSAHAPVLGGARAFRWRTLRCLVVRGGVWCPSASPAGARGDAE